MKSEHPMNLAVLEEVVVLLSFIGLGTVMWLANGGGADWWRGAIPEVVKAYVIRFVVEVWLDYRKKPRLRLTYENAR